MRFPFRVLFGWVTVAFEYDSIQPFTALRRVAPGRRYCPQLRWTVSSRRVPGPARLVRLLSHAGQAPEGQFYAPNREDGSYWFEEAALWKLKTDAQADLRAQGKCNSSALAAYLRLQLRDVLAIRRDWTPSFDYYALLEIPAKASLIALIGRIKKQGVYSRNIPGSSSAGTRGIFLPGGLTQYVINFAHPPNARARDWIESPFRLY